MGRALACTSDEPPHAVRAGESANAGAQAASAWLRQRDLIPPPVIVRWHVEIALDVVATIPPTDFDETCASRFHLDMYSEEWGVFFCHGGRSSWIRVTDIPFVHTRDDHGLLRITPALADIGALVRRLEQLHELRFRRDLALVRSNIASAEQRAREWLTTL